MHRTPTMSILFAFAAFAPLALAQDPLEDRLTLQSAAERGTLSVTTAGTVYKLQFRGQSDAVEYQIDVNHADVKKGYVRVYELYSDSFPITVGGPTFHDAAGNNYLPANLAQYTVMTSHYPVRAGVAIEYRDTVPGNG